ncbi:MAG TPA: TonB-dependent receptor [Polyangiaceae bacterium]
MIDPHPFRFGVSVLLALGVGFAATTGHAQIVVAEPESPMLVPFPEGVPTVETQLVLSLVIDRAGHVESAVVTARAPVDAPAAFDAAALAAAKQTVFRASTRDGHPVRSRIEYVVVFHPPGTSDAARPSASAGTPPSNPEPATQATTSSAAAGPALSTNEQDEDYAHVVIDVHGVAWPSPRGVGDFRIKRELLDASPRQETSEMLSAAPGFFVDHEDGEGLGNDVYLRGFDLEHGSGLEMRVGNVPINSPVHVQGQGYADANFIIPEVVRSIRVLEGPYDPRQGDTAIVGSAYFDLGVPNRGNQLRTSYGSWNQLRLVGIAAPEASDAETFAAFAARKTDGFGQNRASESGTVNAQYGFDVGARDHIRLLATAYSVRATLPGVVRQTDVAAGLIGADDSYPYYSQHQGVQTSRVILGADLDHAAADGTRFEFAPWLMWTHFRARQNFSGNIYSSELDPELAGGMGDLWESSNVETAVGATSRFHGAPLVLGSWLEATIEPGVYVRAGHTDQTKSLLNPETLAVWDRRLDAGLDTLDAGAYFDVDLRFWKRLRLSGGVRADLLAVSVNDRLGYDLPPGAARAGAIPGAQRSTQGVAAGPRLTLEYGLAPELALLASYGEGFRSLDATANVATSAGVAGEGPSIQEGARPYSKVRSVETGVRAETPGKHYAATVSVFETWVANELVFEASSGGFTSEGASLRRGMVASVLSKPIDWLLASVALSASSSTFTTLVPGVSHYVPNVPPILFRADVTARGKLLNVAERAVTGRVGVGYTFLAARHLTDAIVGSSNNVLNANAALRYGSVELGVDAYNLLNLRYADDAEYYVSNWSVTPGTRLASAAIHTTEAPPLSVLGTVSLYF